MQITMAFTHQALLVACSNQWLMAFEGGAGPDFQIVQLCTLAGIAQQRPNLVKILLHGGVDRVGRSQRACGVNRW